MPPRKKKVEPRSIGLAADEVGAKKPPAAVAKLVEQVAEDGGSALATYRDPFGSHWLILAALVQYFKPESPVIRLWPSILIIALAGAINPYIGVMTLLILVAMLLRLALQRMMSLPRAFMWGGLFVAALAGSWLTFGYFAGFDVSNYSGAGYGYFSMNLLSPLDPMQYGSILLPGLPTAHTVQYEGYNYLGLGAIALLVLALLKRPGVLGDLVTARMLPLVILAIFCTLLAVSTTVTVGSKVLFDMEIPERIEKLLTAFRASGRLFWPAHYLLLLAAVVLTYRLWRRSYAVALLSAALVLQFFDLGQLRQSIRSTHAQPALETPLVDEAWRELGRSHSNLVIVPAWQCDPSASPGGRDGFSTFGLLASGQDMTVNSYYVPRMASAAQKLHCAVIPEQVQSGALDRSAAYVLDDKTFVAVGISDNDTHDCRRVDGFNLCVRSPDDNSVKSGWFDLVPEFGYGSIRISDEPSASVALFAGWGSIDSRGARTISSPARLAFRVGDGLEKGKFKAVLHFMAFMIDGRQGYRIMHKGRVLAEQSITAGPGTVFQPMRAVVTLEPDERGMVVVDIFPERLGSPAGQGINSDARTFGLALSKMELVPDGSGQDLR